MSLELPRILSLLRREKGISQKQTAQELGISQALLSHYEKGIRTPGLEFIVRCADYYGVSCDYLLGRSPDRQGSTLTLEDIPHPEAAGKGNVGVGGMLTQLNKKLIANSLNVLFEMLTKLSSKELTGEVSSYLMLSVYRMFRLVYSANPNNEEAMFSVPQQIYSQYTDATMQMIEANAKSISDGNPVLGKNKIENPECLDITTESLSEDYPLFASSILNLIQTAENRIDYKGKKEK